ncbi:MAG: hypothetical protein Aureis2KO_23540 [Aureisphaera sp.]
MKGFWILFCAFTILACANNDDSSDSNAMNDDDGPMMTEVEALGLVTGVRARQTFDQKPLLLGNPNVFVSGLALTAVPNPARDIMFLYSNGTINDVWVIPAEAEKIYQDEDFNAVYSSDSYSINDVENISVVTASTINEGGATVNLEDLDPGYYRIFALVDGTLQWENLYIQSDSEDIDDLIEFWN